MMTENINDAEGTSCDDVDEEIEIVLKITPVLTFASGPWPALKVQVDNSFEMQKSVHEETITQSGHNRKQTNTSDSNNNQATTTSKAEKPGKTTIITLDTNGCPESNTNLSQTDVSPESPSRSRRSHKMALIRSLSSSAAEEKEVLAPSRPTRRLSDSTVPCQKSLVKGTFDRQASLKKLRPYLKRKAVSPLHLLGKVASSTGSKHNHDVGPFKDSKAGNKTRLGKRLYPSFSQKACERLAHGSDPSFVPSEDVCRSVDTVNDYKTMINDYSSQIEGLAVKIEKLSASDTANQEFQESYLSSGSRRQYRQQSGEPEAREDNNNNTENFLREDDIHLQEMLEEVLRSHLLSMEDYSPPSCDRASRSICKIITRLLGGAVKRTGDGQRKLACLVYIGAVRDNGIQMAAQALWCPEEDTFAVASFRNEAVYGLAVVIATPI